MEFRGIIGLRVVCIGNSGVPRIWSFPVVMRPLVRALSLSLACAIFGLALRFVVEQGRGAASPTSDKDGGLVKVGCCLCVRAQFPVPACLACAIAITNAIILILVASRPRLPRRNQTANTFFAQTPRIQKMQVS